jgi:outer membrane lipoprotein-sorting protein
MNILRRASTRQLLIAIIAVVVIAAGSAVAFAGGGGPKPPQRSLADALHRAALARPVQGITARVQFSDHLIPSGSLGSGSPLITGATGRVWAGGGKVRIELQSSAGDTEIGFDGSTVTLYDVSSGTAYTMALPRHAHGSADAMHHHSVPSVADIKKALARLSQHVDLSGAIPGDIAGRPSYTVRVSPRHSGGLLGSVQLAWDATHGVPLRFAVYSRTDASPVLSLTVTDISFGKVPASNLAVPLAPGTKVVKVHMPTHPAQPAASARKHQPAITGPAAVARAVPFRLSAPASVVGLPRHSVRLVSFAGSKTAMAVYGQGLGALVVLEQPVPAKATHSPLAALPTVSINGASAHELDTALGTLIQFDRGGVRYTIVGSLPQAAAEAAARAIG